MPVKAWPQKYIFPYEELYKYKDLGTFVGGSIFAVILPKVPEELNMDSMAIEEIHTKLREGYGDMKAGNVKNASEAFAKFRETH